MPESMLLIQQAFIWKEESTGIPTGPSRTWGQLLFSPESMGGPLAAGDSV